MLELSFCPSTRSPVNPPVRHSISPNEETLSTPNFYVCQVRLRTNTRQPTLIDEASVQMEENCPSSPPEDIALRPMSAPQKRTLYRAKMTAKCQKLTLTKASVAATDGAIRRKRPSP
jgi:hypothetical protein